ncbi:MAG: alkaline phosphatase family protein [Deltaproteobacteria bacterium]|nr:alkaline phosphatase family protein [Deltaproteobacteria bacterium]
MELSRRQFLGLGAAALGLSQACKPKSRPQQKGPGRLIILGFDGADPRLVDRWLSSGDLPQLAGLARRGCLHRLGSTCPPNSPVAWSTFMTGLEPREHGVFGFLRRDPKSYLPGMAPLTISAPRFGPAGVEPARAASLRQGQDFWIELDRREIACSLLCVPYAYPPPSLACGRFLSGLGTPDLRFTNSSFTLFTTARAAPGEKDSVAGGRIVRLDGLPTASGLRTALGGPRGPGGRPLEAELHLARKDSERLEIHLGGRGEQLAPGARSGWFPVRFEAEGLLLCGRLRFHLLAIEPELSLYASPIQIDPARPALPLGGPADWLERAVREHDLPTLGWVHDTSAVNAGALPREVFLGALLDTMEARADLLESELESDAGLVVSVFTGTDRASHIFYRELTRPDGGPLREVYRAMDRIAGRAAARLGPRDRLVVMSDHGFHAFDRMLHVNAFLEAEGFLAREKPDRLRFLRGVDWARTRAYALGAGQVYANLRGREARGSLGREQLAALLAEITKRLLALRDPATGGRPVRAVYPVGAGVEGELAGRAPDLQIAFAPGYRSSWETSLGGAPPPGSALLADNPKAWCGDHAASDAVETPGFLAASAPLRVEDPSLLDLANTARRHFGLPAKGAGRPLFD